MATRELMTTDQHRQRAEELMERANDMLRSGAYASDAQRDRARLTIQLAVSHIELVRAFALADRERETT